jgi:hypothetical protein
MFKKTTPESDQLKKLSIEKIIYEGGVCMVYYKAFIDWSIIKTSC